MPIIESVMGIQVIGNNGENIIKSPIVEAYIGSSLLDSTEVASNTPTDISTKVEQLMAVKHSHSNKAVLDKFAETNGKPTYDGQALGGDGASTAEDVSYTNSQLPNAENVKTALDELVPNSHSHDNKDTLDEISVSNGKLQYNGSDVGHKGDKGTDGANGKDGTNGITPTIGTNGNWYLGTTDTGKPSRGEKGDKGDPGSDANVTKANVIVALGYTPKAVSAQVTTGSNIAFADNTEYRLTDVTTLTLTYPTSNFECWMRLNFAESGNITVTLPADTKYIGTAPDFKNGETWELSFKDKVLAAQKVGEGT